MRPVVSPRQLAVALVLGVPLSGVLAFFLAGAVVFPFVEPYYAARVIASFGLMALVYGAECVVSWGMVETCGLASGHCTSHNLYPWAIRLWMGSGVLACLGLAVLLGLRPSRGRDPRA